MNGVIFTFYSYKGGVGRSMALANIGVHFHRRGFRTLLIDMDLEAPGLERYFEGTEFEGAALAERPGFCDFVQDYLRLASGPAPEGEHVAMPNVDDYITPLGRPGEPGSPALMLMHAGQRSGDGWAKYARFVQRFDWTEFYERWEGGACLEWFAGELRKRADVILIDSRTGVTEMGGVATQHLADAVIVLFGSNLQNVENAAKMAANFACEAVKNERGGRALQVMAAPSRVDDQDSAGFIEFQKRSQAAFAGIAAGAPADGYAMDQMCIPYLAPYSYREVILFGNKEAETSARRMVEAYTRIAANMQRMAPEGSVLREGPRTETAGKTKVAILAASADEATAHGICGAIEVSARLMHVSGIEPFVLGPGMQTETHPAEAIRGCLCAVALVTPAFAESTLMRTMLQLLTDLGKVIIPVLLQPLASMPLLLADKVAIDCTGEVSMAGRSILEAVERLRRPNEIDAGGEGSIFLCYTVENRPLAAELASYLQSRGYSVWWEALISPGANWQMEVERAMSNCELMVAVVSHESRESYVFQEWAYFTQTGKRALAVRVDLERLPLAMAGSPDVFFDSREPHTREFERVAEAVDAEFARLRGKMSSAAPMDSARPPLSTSEAERMAKHINNYLRANSFTKMSFARVRRNINPAYTDEALLELIDQSPDAFRRVTLQSGMPGIGLAQHKATVARKRVRK